MKKVVSFGFVVVSVVGLLGCHLEQEGSLILTLVTKMKNSKTIEPSLNMTVTTFDVVGSGPNGETLEQLGLPSSTATVVENSLAVGAWTVTVEAKNGDPTPAIVGRGTVVVAIAAGQTTSESVTVRPLTGTGTLSVTITWPTGEITSPAVDATLTPHDGTASPITFTISGDEGSYSDSTLEAGYYTLAMQLKDGTTVVWGRTEAVRIIAGKTSFATYNLTLSDINPVVVGSVELDIALSLDNPITITFSGEQPTIVEGSSMTVTATLDPTGTPDSYQWYLNGAAESGGWPSITTGSALGPGNYWLDLVVKRGDILSSDYVLFQVGEATEMVSVPAGTFQMGWTGIADAEPVHTVTLSAFRIAKYEVTYGLWYTVRIWAESNGYTFANLGREGHDGTDGVPPTSAEDEPVTYIGWRDAVAWSNALSEMKGFTPCYYRAGQAHTTENVYKSSLTDGDIGNTDVEWSANGYRLPTEAEWEYAARYVNGTTFTQGDWVSGASAAGQEDAYGWYGDNSGSSTHVVGQKTPNALGVYDMTGNVYEWCWDWKVSYGSSAQSDPIGPTSGENRVVRGGGWSYDADALRAASRNHGPPSGTFDSVGLRPVRAGP